MEIRINKYLSEHGVCSRRGADKLIEEGRVSVNGKPAVMGQTISESDEVAVNGKPVNKTVDKVVLALYKPVGVTVSEKDSHAKTLICDIIDYPIRVTYAGRLDKDSEGLILLTNDGDLINDIMRARNNHQKEYVVTLNKEVVDQHIEMLSRGVYLKDLDRTTKPCYIERIGKNTVRMILTEGLNRQIRRMWKTAGYNVTKLKRIRIENVELGNLKPGQYRELNGDELNELYSIVKKGK